MTASAMGGKTLQQLLGLAMNDCACGQAHRVPTREVLFAGSQAPEAVS